jgi:3-hydroxy-9,10-secoandrosta-1,3,5(10)-triene-9,17-dione monooxygenase reductase component
VSAPVTIDSDLFRQVLSVYPTGVVVVCSETERGPQGMACNSFTSVSLKPPLVAFCPAKSSTTWPRLRASGRFCISVLASHHEPISRLFARREIDRFAGTAVLARRYGPAIADAAAWVDCVLEAEHDAGDHSIVVALVHNLEARGTIEPLVFHRGGYGSFRS